MNCAPQPTVDVTIRRGNAPGDVVIDIDSETHVYEGPVAAFVAEWFPRVRAGEIPSVTFHSKNEGKQ